MQADFKALTDAIAAIGNISTWQIVGVVTAAGTIAMAMLQLVKDLMPIRRWYQRQWLGKWIATHADAFNNARKRAKVSKKALPGASAQNAETLLVELATGGDDRAFYELAIEQMVAQMNAAVQITLDYPKKYCDLLVVVSQGADVDDVAAVISQSPGGAENAQDPFGRLSGGAVACRPSHPAQSRCRADIAWQRLAILDADDRARVEHPAAAIGRGFDWWAAAGRHAARDTGRNPWRLSCPGRARSRRRSANAAQISHGDTRRATDIRIVRSIGQQRRRVCGERSRWTRECTFGAHPAARPRL